MAMVGLWEQRLLRDHRRVMILDDDPTGTQTVADVEVILRPSLSAYREFFASPARAVYVLTNSRALASDEARALIELIYTQAQLAAQEAGETVAFVLRGDSTLRGHVFKEVDALASAFQDAVCLFVPAFPEGGRVTTNGVHYLITGTSKVPVNQTEFARDPIFGYTSERIADWVAEVGQGRRGLSLPLEQIRAQGSSAIAQALLGAAPGTVIVPDAETRADLETIASGLLDAEEQGQHVVVRSASTFATIRAGLKGANVQSVQRTGDGVVLVVCGSHTLASSRQLDALVQRTSAPVILPTDWLLNDGPEVVVPRLAQQLRLAMDEHKFAILATERVRHTHHSSLHVGAQIMAAVTAIVALLEDRCDAVISKGGITSAQVATDGLAATHAYVQGQLEAGVSLWELTLPSGRRLPYAVIPGNVGNDQTLVHIATQFQAAPFRSTNAPG